MEFQFVNTLGGGNSATLLQRHNMDGGILRPWLETDDYGRETGRAFVTLNTGRKDKDGLPVVENRQVDNATALLRREDWLKVDEAVMWASKLRLQLWADVYGTNPYDIPDGFSWMAIQHAVAAGDATANLSMDGLRKSERSRPVLDVGLLPLPITHSDGSMSARELAQTRRSGMPLDTTSIALATRAVSEITEQLTLGTWPSFSFAGGTIYGLRNFPFRQTKVITSPLTGGYTPQTTTLEVLAMIQQLEDLLFYGPYVLYVSTGWGQYFDRDYVASGASGIPSLRARLNSIPKIRKVVSVDYLPDYEMILVQPTPDVIQGVEGMPLQVVQWQSGDGMEQLFKVMCIRVPRLRTDFRGNTGILHATGSLGGTTTSTTTTTTTTT